MSKHHYEDCCCQSPMMAGYGGGGMTGMAGYGGVAGYGGGGYNYGGMWYIRFIYAFLILIVIVLQFGRRREFACPVRTNECETDGAVAGSCGGGFFGNNCDNEVIDRSVLFIIVVFLLILCTGCWGGGIGGGGFGGGYGSYY